MPDNLPRNYASPVTIHLNLNQYTWPEERLTVAQIMERRRFTFPQIIVKVNGRVVPRNTWKDFEILDGDEVEMLHLVAGG